MDRISALVIAPYPELATQCLALQTKYPVLDMHTFVGYYQNAPAYTRAFPDQHFDVVISRGGTAILLKQLIDTPVIDINVHSTDIICVMQQAVAQSQNVYLVSYPHVVEEAAALIELLQLPVKLVSFEDADGIEAAVTTAITSGAKLIIGGAATKNYVLEQGCEFLLIQSGSYCIEAGLRRAIDYVQMSKKSNGPNNIYRDLINKIHTAVFLYDDFSEIRLATIPARQLLGRYEKIDHVLVSLIPILKQNIKINQLKKIEQQTYHIIGEPMLLDGESLYIFEIYYYGTTSKAKSFLWEEELLTPSKNPFTSGYIRQYAAVYENRLTPALHRTLPVLIEGPIGTQKQIFAYWIHQNRPSSGSSFIRVNCGDITAKNWAQHLENVYSPLHASGYTLFFEDIDQMPLPLQRSMSSYIRDTNLTKRHRIITSSNQNLFTLTKQGRFDSSLFLQLSGIIVDIPSLKEEKSKISTLVHYMIAHFNIQLGTTITTPEAESIELLENFDWPYNFSQLERVLRETMALSKSYFIEYEEVNSILKREQRQIAPLEQNLSLEGTLDEMEQKIILQVLQEEHMNQSAAAKRLGIGRSTLWRKISNCY